MIRPEIDTFFLKFMVKDLQMQTQYGKTEIFERGKEFPLVRYDEIKLSNQKWISLNEDERIWYDLIKARVNTITELKWKRDTEEYLKEISNY